MIILATAKAVKLVWMVIVKQLAQTIATALLVRNVSMVSVYSDVTTAATVKKEKYALEVSVTEAVTRTLHARLAQPVSTVTVLILALLTRSAQMARSALVVIVSLVAETKTIAQRILNAWTDSATLCTNPAQVITNVMLRNNALAVCAFQGQGCARLTWSAMRMRSASMELAFLILTYLTAARWTSPIATRLTMRL